MPDTNKVFQTRIQLKYDTYANWKDNNPVLKAGEMAIATVASGDRDDLHNLPNIIQISGKHIYQCFHTK